MPDYVKQGARQRAWRNKNQAYVLEYNAGRAERRAADPAAVAAYVARREDRRAWRDAWRAAHPRMPYPDHARRAAKDALPAGATCAVCGTASGIVRDRVRSAVLCRPCLTGASVLRTAERAAALAQYLACT